MPPVIPLALAMSIAHQPVRDSDTASGNQDPAERGRGAKGCRGRHGGAHEDVAHAVDDHEALDGGAGGLVAGRQRELEEGETVCWPQDGVDAKADADGGEEVGGRYDGR